MPSTAKDLKIVREKLRDLFITPARNYGQPKVAKAIEEILPKLSKETVDYATAEKVTPLSQKAKEESLVDSENWLDIVGIIPDWWPLEKGIIGEKAKKGPVEVGFRPPVEVGFRGYKPIPLKVMEEMKAAGVPVKRASGVTSLNLSPTSVTLYYTPDPLGPPSLPQRTGIRITGKPGRILATKLNAIRSEWFSDEAALGRQMEELIAARALELIVGNLSDLRLLKEIMKSQENHENWRIALMLHCLQIHDDRFYSVFEIAKELELRPELVRGQVFSWYRCRDAHPFQNFKFDFTTKGEEKIKLLSKAKDHVVPWTFYEVLVVACAAGDSDAKKLMEKYGLPPIRKRGLLTGQT